MNRIFYFGVLALVSLLICSATGAQMRGGGASARSIPARPLPPATVTTVARPASISATPHTPGVEANRRITVVQVAPDGQLRPENRPFAIHADFDRENEGPGLGFDYPHLAAINGDFPDIPIRIDFLNNNNPNLGRGGHDAGTFFAPSFVGGYPYLPDFTYSSDNQQVQQQPQIIVIQQPAPVVAAQPTNPVPQALAETAVQSTTPPSTSTSSAARVKDLGSFILLRRDGRVLFASAFSVSGIQLRYITPQGILRMVPLAELDADATRQMNDTLGTTVDLHN
jgi:hypothetical protein